MTGGTSDGVIVGLDAGTSVIKAVAFDVNGRQLGVASRPNSFNTLPDGGAEQNMDRTFADAAAALKELGEVIDRLNQRIIVLSVTGQGDGCWLIDKDDRPVHDGWLWLDARAVGPTRRLTQSPAMETIYARTATGLNPCQMRTQLAFMKEAMPELLTNAATAFHCKDWLYLRLTGERATDPTEGGYTFGDYRTRAYSDEVFEALGLSDLKHLMPPIVDGSTTAHPLTAEAAKVSGLPEGLPVTLGYLDIMCSAMGAGLMDADIKPGLSVLGSTGVHMRYAPNVDAVVLNEDRNGYTMPFPGTAYGQMQTNMAATLNIDWMLDIAIEILASEGVARTRADLLNGLDAKVLAARPGAALYHPYISFAGERGPFVEPDARASFTGLDQSAGWFDLVRATFEGLALAARDCYAVMGPIPSEVRLSGGAARSKALRAILAATLGRPLRTVAQAESGAAGAAMIAAVQQGLYPSIDACADAWVTPLLEQAEAPDETLTGIYDTLYDRYVATRTALAPTWSDHAAARKSIHAAMGEGA